MATERIQAKTWRTEECAAILDRLITGERPRFGALHEKVKKRREHFHNLEEANPKLPAPYTGKSTYQSDVLRRTHIKHRARITENAPVARVTPPTSSTAQKTLATNFGEVLNRVYDIVQERTGVHFQSAMSDGQDRDCFAVLHWVKADHIWPKFPDAELCGELPEDEHEAKRYEPQSEGEGYVETDASRQQRDQHAKARAGVPWHIEVVDPRTVGFVEDISAQNGFGVFVTCTEVGFLDYSDSLRKTDGLVLSLNDADGHVHVDMERQRPAEGLPSAAASWGPKIQVGVVWNREECYELVRGEVNGSNSPWEMVKSFTHPYEMPPFAVVYAHRNQHPDPVLAYEPVLEGLYRIKPSYDYIMALNEIIAQSIALPVWWIERQDGTPRLDERGKPVVLSRDSVHAHELQPGEKLVKADFDLNPAFIELMKLRQEELKDAAPNVGLSEVSATTQAWAILLQEQQASIEPKQIVLEQERALRTMFRNMALVMSKNADEGGFGQPIWVYGKTKDGKIDASTAIGIEPKDIPTLEVDVEINPRSAAEVITREQHGAAMLKDRLITLPEFEEDYRGVDNPQQATKDNIAWWSYVDYVQPGLIKQMLGKKYAQFITMGPDGTFVGFDGMRRTPAQVLQANGVMPSPVGPGAPAAAAGMPPASGAGTLPTMGAAPAPLPPLAPPTAVQQPGIPVAG